MSIFQLTDNPKVSTNVEPVKQTAPVQQDADKQKESIQQASEDPKNQETQKLVALDGPLSQIYAKALMIAYSQEDMAAMLRAKPETNEEDLTPQEAQAEGIYMYCMDTDEMDQGDIVEAGDKLRLALDSKKYKEVVVAGESFNVSPKLASFNRYMSGIGVKVIHIREAAIERVGRYIKG